MVRGSELLHTAIAPSSQRDASTASHKRLRTNGGNPNSNVSNSVIAASSRGRGRGGNGRNRGRSSRFRGNQKASKTVDNYQWGTIYNFVNTNVTAHPYFETSRPARSINETLQPLEFFYKTFPRKTIQ